MNEKEIADLAQERTLNQQIASLAKEQATATNLWPGIKAEITAPVIKQATAKWIPWAIAASLIVSVGSVVFSLSNLRQAEVLYAQIEAQESEWSPYQRSVSYQVELMEKEYRQAKIELMKSITMNHSRIDTDIILEVEATLLGIEHATTMLKAAIKEQPDNDRLPLLLKATYQQEISVLTQLAKLERSI